MRRRDELFVECVWDGYSVVMDGDRGLRLTARIPASLESLVVDYALLHGRSRSWAVGRLLLLGLSVAAREVK